MCSKAACRVWSAGADLRGRRQNKCQNRIGGMNYL